MATNYELTENGLVQCFDPPKRLDFAGRWIPVTERFPEPVCAQTRRKTKPVLLYSPKGGFYVGWYYGKDYRGHLFKNRTSKDSLQYITTKVTHWMPLPEPPKEETVNEITPEMIEAAERNEKRIKERVDRIYDELIAEKRAEIERLKAEIAKMPPLDYDKLAENPPEYPVCVGYKCWDGKEADNGNK